MNYQDVKVGLGAERVLHYRHHDPGAGRQAGRQLLRRPRGSAGQPGAVGNVMNVFSIETDLAAGGHRVERRHRVRPGLPDLCHREPQHWGDGWRSHPAL